jgi:hypothetical protein
LEQLVQPQLVQLPALKLELNLEVHPHDVDEPA